MKEKIESYIIGILIPFAIGLLSTFFTRNNMDLYQTIARPALAPPAIVFPIVWSILYILMGVGSTIVYNSDTASEREKKNAMLIYALQLAFNFFWSIIFFNLRNFGFSLVWIIALWVLIIIMLIRFTRISPLAALLQIPYLLWVTFATYLNYMIYSLNG